MSNKSNAIWLTWLRKLTAAGALLSASFAIAAPLVLSQSPAGAAREPAPNVIISVDDSGSMGAAGINTLKAALTQTFAATKVEDGRIRLAWQSMNGCRTFDGTCPIDNRMKPLLGTHRSNFMSWVNGLSQGGGTPGHQMMFNAGEYLKAPLGSDSPWATEFGASTPTYLSCRKAFHIYMTDGGHNSGWTGIANAGSQVDTSGQNFGARRASGGNADGNASFNLPDGTLYDITSNQTRLYRDTWGQGTSTLSTLADLAFHYWSTDLQTSLTNDVRATPKEQFPADNFGSSVTLSPYWNPRNDPANWQHMVTYAIGFNNAAAWTGSPTWTAGHFENLAPMLDSTVSLWPSPFCGVGSNEGCDGSDNYGARDNERKTELWHLALNSRGEFIPAPTADSLVTAFQTILEKIFKQTANPMVSIATASSRLRSDSFVYVAGYTSDRWSGHLGAYPISAATNAITATPTWVASTYLDSSTTTVPYRLIATSNDTGTTSAALSARSFAVGSLTAAHLSNLGSTATGQEQVLNYVRGTRNQEVRYGGSLRSRDSRLGDIVNSNIWMTTKPTRLEVEYNDHKAFRTTSTAASRSPTLYVGANDGMLHAFAADTGVERFAYIPRAALSSLANYSQVTYGHKYFVDGHPFTGDADVSYVTSTTTTADWRTLLVSGLGAGGRGYFVLDVTNPNSYTDTNIGALVVADWTLASSVPGTTGTSVAHDLGHIFAAPVTDAGNAARSEQIRKMNNGRWAVIMGNGINSANERPVLLIQYLDGTKGVVRIIADSTTGLANGLSAPRPVDMDGNGTVDIVYAGDLRGNVWKFDLSSATDTNWGVSKFSGISGDATCNNLSTCVPFFVTTDGLGARQPVTVAPLWMAHPNGGIQVLVGTGRNVTDADRADTSTQSIYSVWDQSKFTKPAASTVIIPLDQARITGSIRASLVTQTVVSSVTSTFSGTTSSTDYFNTSQNEVTYSWVATAAKRGWFMDLPASRERVLSHPQNFEGQKVLIATNVPKVGATGETCDFDLVTEDNWINVLNMISGKPSAAPVFSVSDATMNMNYATRTRFGSGDFITVYRKDAGKDFISTKTCPDGTPATHVCQDKQKADLSGSVGATADWREVR